MKRKLLLFLVLATLTVPLSAQTRYTATVVEDAIYNIYNGYPCPVANINLSYSLAAVKMNATTTAFCLLWHDNFCFVPFPVSPAPAPIITAKAAFNAFSAPITDFTVNDMVLVNQYAFFCGTVNGTEAFYGYFNYGALFGTASTLDVYIYSLSYMTTTPPVTLKKLVAYKEEEKFKVVAIGDENISPDYCTSKVVEIFDATGSPTCMVADMPNNSTATSSLKIYLDDIVLTDNYVVVLGHDVGIVEPCNDVPGTRFLWFSMGNRANVVGDICDPLNSHNYFLPSPMEVYDAVAGVALGNDKFGIAYVYSDPFYVLYTRFRVIDVIPGVPITNSYSQQFFSNSKITPVDMTFLSGIGMVEMLQPVIHPSDFIQLRPYATSNYSTTMFSPNDNEFKSLDRVGPFSSYRFISTRNAEFYLQDRTVNLPHNNPTCPESYDMDVDVIEELPIEQYICPIEKGENEANLFFAPPESFSVIYTPLNNQCYSNE